MKDVQQLEGGVRVYHLGSTQRSKGCQGTNRAGRAQPLAGAGWVFKMVPSPGGQEAWARRLQCAGLVSTGFPDLQLKFHRGEKRRRQPVSRNPNLSPEVRASPLRRISSEVTVPGARGARGAPRTELHRQP